jgi:leucyl/phenylalanyl-tRNA--protein transferase
VPVYRLGRRLVFPPPEDAEDGLLAVGGDLSPDRLLLAYRSGIFPWYDEDSPILWHSPDPRCVFVLASLRPSRSLRKVLTRGVYEVRYDEAFARVIRACKEARRPGQGGTWITDAMERAYVRLHGLGYAHSVESYRDGELAGGLYGVSIGRMFFGESMFAWQPDASKVALMTLASRLRARGWSFIDSQVANAFSLSLGAEQWPRSEYLARLAPAVAAEGEVGKWTADVASGEAQLARL